MGLGVKVELRPAWVWTCDECGLDNYESIIQFETSPEAMEASSQDLKSVPDQVQCQHCGHHFDTEAS